VTPTQQTYQVAGSPVFIKKKKGKSQQANMTGERLTCGCQGTVHPFVNNCLDCGYIACEVEGAGPCPNCGTYVNARANTEECMLFLFIPLPSFNY
jgi:hypothetical protein